MERRPVEEDVEPREALRSWGLGACFGPSKPPFDIVFFLGGLVIRVAALPAERFVSLVEG